MDQIQFMTINEAAIFLNLKVSKLRRYVFMRTIPYYKIGSLIRFKKADLLQWVEEQIIKPIAPFPQR